MFCLFLMTHHFTILRFIWLNLWDPSLKWNLNASKSAVIPSEVTAILKNKRDQTLPLFLGVTEMSQAKPAPLLATQGSAVGAGSNQAGGRSAGVHRLANQILFNLCRRTVSTAAARWARTSVQDFYSLRSDFKFWFPGELILWISVSHVRLSNCSLI